MSKHHVDPISTEVIRNAFNAIAEDMGAILNRSAYSPVIYECHDYGAALFNEKAETLGQAPGLPLFTGGLDAGIVATIEKYGAGGIADGDVFIVNDSYITGGHLNDVDIIGAICFQEQLVGFACIRAHWMDVGMADEGFPVNTTQIYQEGLRLPPTRIMVDGKWVQDVIDVICLNSRLPKVLLGDLNAQVAAAKMGIQRMKALLGRFGLPTVRAATENIFAATEAKFREFISRIPDGDYEAHGTSDDDFISSEPVPVHVKVTVSGSDMVIDTAGTSPQRAGNLNCGYANSLSAARLALALLYPSAEPEINHGAFRPMKFIAESGSIFAAKEPAPCMRPHPVMLLTDLIIRALADVLPEDVAAGLPGDSWNVMIMGEDPNTKEFFISMESLCGGWGANHEADGASAVTHSAAGDFRNTPVETLEHRFPIRINRFQLGRDSGGAGRFRGGLNVIKEYELLVDSRVTVHFDRSLTPQWGLCGGAAGASPRVRFYSAGAEVRQANKIEQLPLKKGARVVCETGGGGGYGKPTSRARERVAADVRRGFVSLDAAQKLYGFDGASARAPVKQQQSLVE